MLRDYQELALRLIRQEWKSGNKKVLLQMPTGSGKTVVFSEILKGAFQKGNRAIMTVKGRELVDQASRRLMREHVLHGVHMAKHWNERPSAPIQICSIDTMRARKKYPPAPIVIVDEADEATSPSYIEMARQYPDAFFLGVTATPYTRKTLRHIANKIIKPTSFNELINRGYLVPPRYYAPSTIDESGLKISSSTRDYVSADVEAAIDAGNIIGDAVSNYYKHGEHRPFILFAPSVEHSRKTARAFNEAGINVAHCEADTPEDERKRIFRDLESGAINGICNMGVLTRGFDLPRIACIIMLRKTLSYSLYIQMLGRGTRPSLNKSDFLVFDHVGNIIKHGFMQDEPEGSVDGLDKLPGPPPLRTCAACYAIFTGFACPSCGLQSTLRASGEREIITVEGELQEITELPKKPTFVGSNTLANLRRPGYR